MLTERPLVIAAEATLLAILHEGNADTGVLILVGGPQYRVGSHRQFVKLSRALAEQQVPSLRLDFAGMGDSRGTAAAFYQRQTDINAAIDCFFQAHPQLKRIVLWGLCDAASAAMLHCYRQQDNRIAGLVLLNPWVRCTESLAEVKLKHYYLQRLTDKAFWQKLLSGGLNFGRSLRDFSHTWRQSRQKNTGAAKHSPATINQHNYIGFMLKGWQQFDGDTLLISSGNDLTAQEFLALCRTDARWQQLLSKAEHHHLTDANHTFSTAQWRQHVEQLTLGFVQRLAGTDKQDS
ncbi:hydrolase 1, exosortase A system-associated [Rheinheimera sp. NSM]|uniref:hydrolase 1, exosortase A system-associated n=1 Tax=Rheinheimera sp. NSM TaxID=3457884 RepID=UPI00403713F0